jgi:hypothetical protein
VTTDNQPISAARAAALLLALLPELARAETYPQWSDGGGAVVRRQRVTLYDAAGGIVGADQAEHRSVLRVLMQVEGGDWDRPQTFDVAAEALSLTYAVVDAVPLWESPLAVDPYRLAQLVAQRHELEDDPEPPLLSDGDVSTAADYPDWVPPHTDPAADYAASVAAGHTTPVAWEDAPVCEPVFVERTAEDVPVQGGAL